MSTAIASSLHACYAVSRRGSLGVRGTRRGLGILRGLAALRTLCGPSAVPGTGSQSASGRVTPALPLSTTAGMLWSSG